MSPSKNRSAARLGWAIYLRTSSKEVQNPEASQKRQRHSIEQNLIRQGNLGIVAEYSDIETGRNPNRTNYQRMLHDARQGKFSHVAIENAERFGRNDTEALRAIDELDMLGVQVRFADYPDLDPTDADDRIVVTILFSMARRESMKLSARVRGGLHTKLRSGGHIGKAPDGYVNKQELNMKHLRGRSYRWIEPDPEQFQVWVEAWDLLLTDQYTLKEICEILHARGYTMRDGRPFVKTADKGKRTHATNVLSRNFRNWFYAGFVVSKKAAIPPKTVPGDWTPVVSVEDFERGLAILDQRVKIRAPRRKHFYLLRKILYVEMDGKLSRLSGSTPNTRRNTGGNRYYCLPSSDVNIPCDVIDGQIPEWMESVVVDPEHISYLQDAYRLEISNLDFSPKKEIDRLKRLLEEKKQEETRLLRVYMRGKFTEDVWDRVWEEVAAQQSAMKGEIALLEESAEASINNLDEALDIFNRLTTLYGRLMPDEQQKILGLLVQRIVVNTNGQILRVELHPPFTYLVNKYDEVKKQLASSSNKNTTLIEGGVQDKIRSEYVPSCSANKIINVSMDMSPRRKSGQFGGMCSCTSRRFCVQS